MVFPAQLGRRKQLHLVSLCKLQLVTLRDVIWALVLTAGFVVGERVDRARRKKKAMKDKIENELKKK